MQIYALRLFDVVKAHFKHIYILESVTKFPYRSGPMQGNLMHDL